MRKRLNIFILFLSICLSMQSQQTLQWAKSFSGNGFGYITTFDNLGNVYSVGNFTGTVDFDPGPGIYTVTASGANDMFLTKVDPNGNLIGVRTTEGGPGSSINPSSIRIDSNGNMLICGSFAGNVDFDPGMFSFFMNTTGGPDSFIMKWDALGNFIWSKQIGVNNNNEYASSIDFDNTGNLYVTGGFYTITDLDPGPSVYTVSSNGMRDIYIVKTNSSGSFVWGKNFGGLSDDAPYTLKVDGFGGIWSTGYFDGIIDFDPGPGLSMISSGANIAAYISKLNMNGDLVLARAFTAYSGGYVGAFDITLDAIGNVYSTGYFSGTTDFDPNSSVFNLTSNGSNDAYVSKLDNSGNFIWAKCFGGINNDVGRAITIDNESNVYVTGSFQSNADFDPGTGSFLLTSAGLNDIYINKLDVNGNFQCASAMGGTGEEMGFSIATNSNYEIFVTGFFENTVDFDPGPNSFTITSIGVYEPYLCSFKQNFTGTPLSYTICSGASTVLTGLGANTYSWSPSQGLSSTTGSNVLASPTVNTTYTVVGNTGCIRTTTLINITVLPKPNLTTQALPINLICDPDSVLLQSTSTTTNVLLQWRKQTSSTYTNEPYYAKVSGPYYSKVTNLSTGCADSSLITVNNFKIYPNAKITSHNYVSALIPLDTVTCYSPTINVTGASDTSGVVVSWKSVSSNSLFGNPIPVTSLGNYKLFVKRNDNNCVDSSIIVLINQNTTKPSIVTNTNNLILNCSIYTASLNASFSPSNCNVFWLSPTNAVLANPNSVNVAGNYKFSATDPDNGCVKMDSVTITQSNLLLFNVSNDTTVCKNSAAYLSASAIGTLSNISYTWSTSQSTNSITVNPSITSNYIVSASGGVNCFGTDTINVTIPADIKDSIVTVRSCDNYSIGNIIVFASGGISPYKYSIDNGITYTTTNTFQNIPFGNYNVVIKDSIGCTKQALTVLNANSNLPVPKFLASTKNFKADTIVLVDVSIPKPDSVHWLLPPIANIVGGTMFSPVVAFSDTGSFVVTMKSFYGNCIINATKLVKFAPYDSLVANLYNANGIKTFSLYPNPNNGQFTVYVEFYKKQDASVQIYDVNSYKHYQQNYSNVQSFTLPIDVSYLLNGAYMLRVIGEYDAKNRSFIISK
ncbi:MAG: SBBP repeat-containing protein [Sphingobacteriaceae bacterium]